MSARGGRSTGGAVDLARARRQQVALTSAAMITCADFCAAGAARARHLQAALRDAPQHKAKSICSSTRRASERAQPIET